MKLNPVFFTIPKSKSLIWLVKLYFSFLNIFKVKKHYLLETKSLNSLKSKKNLLEEEIGGSYTHTTDINVNPFVKEFIAPKVELFEIRSAIVNLNSSSFIYNQKLYFEKINSNEDIKDGNFLLQLNDSHAIVKQKKLISIDSGIFLGGNGSWNWYHFIIEILPKALLLNEINCSVLLVSEILKTTPNMNEALKRIISGMNFKIIYMKYNASYLVKKMYYVSEVNKIEFNKIDPSVVSNQPIYFRKDILKQISNKLLVGYCDMSKKIFLWRDNTHRIAQNQEEVFDLLEKYHFRKINFSVMSLNTQIRIMNYADVIVGTTGAAWTNLIFCKPKTKAIIFSPKDLKDFHAFSNLAKVFEVDLIYSYYHIIDKNHSTNQFLINITELENILKTFE